jgi:hypothetical protein
VPDHFFPIPSSFAGSIRNGFGKGREGLLKSRSIQLNRLLRNSQTGTG